MKPRSCCLLAAVAGTLVGGSLVYNQFRLVRLDAREWSQGDRLDGYASVGIAEAEGHWILYDFERRLALRMGLLQPLRCDRAGIIRIVQSGPRELTAEHENESFRITLPEASEECRVVAVSFGAKAVVVLVYSEGPFYNDFVLVRDSGAKSLTKMVGLKRSPARFGVKPDGTILALIGDWVVFASPSGKLEPRRYERYSISDISPEGAFAVAKQFQAGRPVGVILELPSGRVVRTFNAADRPGGFPYGRVLAVLGRRGQSLLLAAEKQPLLGRTAYELAWGADGVSRRDIRLPQGFMPQGGWYEAWTEYPPAQPSGALLGF